MQGLQLVLTPFVWILMLFLQLFSQLRHRADFVRRSGQANPVSLLPEGQAEHDPDEHDVWKDAEAAEDVWQQQGKIQP